MFSSSSGTEISRAVEQYTFITWLTVTTFAWKGDPAPRKKGKNQQESGAVEKKGPDETSEEERRRETTKEIGTRRDPESGCKREDKRGS